MVDVIALRPHSLADLLFEPTGYLLRRPARPQLLTHEPQEVGTSTQQILLVGVAPPALGCLFSVNGVVYPLYLSSSAYLHYSISLEFIRDSGGASTESSCDFSDGDAGGMPISELVTLLSTQLMPAFTFGHIPSDWVESRHANGSNYFLGGGTGPYMLDDLNAMQLWVSSSHNGSQEQPFTQQVFVDVIMPKAGFVSFGTIVGI